MRGRSQRWNICTIEAACNVSEMRGRRKGKFEVEDEDEMGGEERKWGGAGRTEESPWVRRDSTRRLSSWFNGGDSAVIMDGWDKLALLMITPVPTRCGSREYQPTCVDWVLSGPIGSMVVYFRPLDTCLDPRVHLRELQRVFPYKSFKTKQLFVVAIFGIFRAFLHRKNVNLLLSQGLAASILLTLIQFKSLSGFKIQIMFPPLFSDALMMT